MYKFFSHSLIIVKNLVAVFIHFGRVLEVHLRGGGIAASPNDKKLSNTYKPHDAFVQYAIALLTPKTYPLPRQIWSSYVKVCWGAQGPSHL